MGSGMSQVWLMGIMLLSPAMAAELPLSVEVEHIGHCHGALMLAVYDRQAAFLHPAQAVARVRLPLPTAPCVERISQTFRLPAGTYAVAAYHDGNDNGTLDSNWLGMPSEPWGVSNGVRPALRAPDFAESRFHLDPSHFRITISLR